MEAEIIRNSVIPLIDLGSFNSNAQSGFICVSWKPRKRQFLQIFNQATSPSSLKSLCYRESIPLLANSRSNYLTDEDLILKAKSQEILPFLNGRCIYLVGMMGSGKTTVGKVLSQALGYSFFDSDALIEQSLNGTPVAEIFSSHGEDFFRNKETEILQKLSAMQRLVVSTGGGTVTRPANWIYMHKGISIWLDVPLGALAHRIAAVGTDSRPLLQDETGDEYTKALKRLSALYKERGGAYANAAVKVSVQKVATEHGHDPHRVTPAMIAIEAVEQIRNAVEERQF